VKDIAVNPVSRWDEGIKAYLMLSKACLLAINGRKAAAVANGRVL